jgi:hypothetical protein
MQIWLKQTFAETTWKFITFESIMTDERKFDESRVLRLIDSFIIQKLGLKIINRAKE